MSQVNDRLAFSFGNNASHKPKQGKNTVYIPAPAILIQQGSVTHNPIYQVLTNWSEAARNHAITIKPSPLPVEEEPDRETRLLFSFTVYNQTFQVDTLPSPDSLETDIRVTALPGPGDTSAPPAFKQLTFNDLGYPGTEYRQLTLVDSQGQRHNITDMPAEQLAPWVGDEELSSFHVSEETIAMANDFFFDLIHQARKMFDPLRNLSA